MEFENRIGFGIWKSRGDLKMELDFELEVQMGFEF